MRHTVEYKLHQKLWNKLTPKALDYYCEFLPENTNLVHEGFKTERPNQTGLGVEG